MTDNRYMMRGVSAAKEDVHNAINIHNVAKNVCQIAFFDLHVEAMYDDVAACDYVCVVKGY